MENVHFKNVNSLHIKNCFLEALQGFPPLRDRHISLVQRPISKTTMRAQPVLGISFWLKPKRRFKVEINNRAKIGSMIQMEDLERPVLIGWFAHELGHIMDYLERGPMSMIGFALGYLFFPTFRTGAERRADLYAIDYGFADYILATKKFILEQSELSNTYKRRIERYYMSPAEVALLVENRAEDESLAMDQLL